MYGVFALLVAGGALGDAAGTRMNVRDRWCSAAAAAWCPCVHRSPPIVVLSDELVRHPEGMLR